MSLFKFVLGAYVAFKAQLDTQHAPLHITTIAGLDRSCGMYFIQHPQGHLPADLLLHHPNPKKVLFRQKETVSQQTLLVVDEQDLQPVDFDHLPSKLPLALRAKAAIFAQQEPYLGRLVLRGELACLPRTEVERLIQEHKAQLDALKTMFLALEPLLAAPALLELAKKKPSPDVLLPILEQLDVPTLVQLAQQMPFLDHFKPAFDHVQQP